LVYPLDTRGGSTIITAISNGTIAHIKNHDIGLRPFLIAIMLPTIPAMITSKTYLNNGILYLFMIICLSLLYLTYANKWYRPPPVTCGRIPFHFSMALRLASIFLSSIRSIEIFAFCNRNASAFAAVIVCSASIFILAASCVYRSQGDHPFYNYPCVIRV